MEWNAHLWLSILTSHSDPWATLCPIIENFLAAFDFLSWSFFLSVSTFSGNFGTERHFLEGFVSPQILPALQNGARPAMFRRESSYSSTSDEAGPWFAFRFLSDRQISSFLHTIENAFVPHNILQHTQPVKTLISSPCRNYWRKSSNQKITSENFKNTKWNNSNHTDQVLHEFEKTKSRWDRPTLTVQTKTRIYANETTKRGSM